MPKKKSSPSTGKVAVIKAKIQKLQDQLKALTSAKPAKASSSKRTPGKRTMSAEAREKIAAAQRRRWAKAKGKSSKAAPKAAKAVKSAKAAKPGKRTMSAEAREKIAAAQRRRWAKTKR